MANPGERFEMPDGSVYVVTVPAGETGGEFVEMEFILPAGCIPPPPHVHPAQIESYEVLEGTFEVLVGSEWKTLTAGESASVPVGEQHTFRNSSGETVRVLNRHEPAIRFEQFIERINSSLAETGITRPRDPRIAICMSVAMLEYDDTLVPSRRRDLIPMKVLAGLGRLFGIPPASGRPG
jgi:quercetin dioxygenase-like cupin family protein